MAYDRYRGEKDPRHGGNDHLVQEEQGYYCCECTECVIGIPVNEVSRKKAKEILNGSDTPDCPFKGDEDVESEGHFIFKTDR